jgi:hypothetical protein
MPTEALKEPLEKLCCHVCFDPCRGKTAPGLISSYHTMSKTGLTPRFIHIQADGYFLSCLTTCFEHEPKAEVGLRQPDMIPSSFPSSSDDAP